MTDDLTILGHRVSGPLKADQLETFAAPPGCYRVVFTSSELTAYCPVTHQPDFYDVTIAYEPEARCVESKTLKLYLMSFRERGAFAENLAAEIATDVFHVTGARRVEVTLLQQVRGGLRLEAHATRTQHDSVVR